MIILIAALAVVGYVAWRPATPTTAGPPPAMTSTPITSGSTPGAPAAPAPVGSPMTVTFYAAHDNDPPGSTAIAFPQLHDEAAGVGTWEDPLTFAADPRFLAPGTRIYDPRLQKYFLMEDSCASCIEEWSATREPHVDLWTGPATDAAVLDCESALTPDGQVPIEVSPPPDRPVDTVALYDEATDTCHVP